MEREVVFWTLAVPIENAASAVGISPKAVENMVITSFRYYLP